MEHRKKNAYGNTMDNVDSINYLRQKIEVIQRSLSDVRLAKIDDRDDAANDSIKSSSSSTSAEAVSSANEELDSIKSCESMLKIFCFEPREFNKKNEKCLEFWNLINNHPEIQPINCVIMDAQNNKRDSECQTEQVESEASLWVRALHELQKKKMHHAALAISTNACKYCKEPIDSYEVSDDDNLSELNYYNPRCVSVFGKPLHSKSDISMDSSDQKFLAKAAERDKRLINKDKPLPPQSKLVMGQTPLQTIKIFPKIKDYVDVSVVSENTAVDGESVCQSAIKNTSEVSVEKTEDQSVSESTDKDVVDVINDVLEDVDVVTVSANLSITVGKTSDSTYNSTIKNTSEVTLEKAKEPSQKTSIKVVQSTVNEELIKSLSNALQMLEIERESGSLRSDASQEFGERSGGSETAFSSKGIMDSWGQAPPGIFKKISPKTSSTENGELAEEEGEFSGKSQEALDNKEKMEPSKEPRNQIDERELKKRDNYNYAQNTLSLLHIDVNEYRAATAKGRKKLLQDVLKENYSRFIKRDPPGRITPPCPCDVDLQKQTKSYCSCELGVCKIPKELDTADLAELSKYMPYGPGLECMKLMIEGIKQIRKKKLTIGESSEQVRQLLKSVQDREILDGPCRCPLHRIDAKDIDEQLEDAKFIKDMIYHSLDDALNEKYGNKLGVKSSRRPREEGLQFDDYEVETADVITKAKRICMVCGKVACQCGNSTYKVVQE